MLADDVVLAAPEETLLPPLPPVPEGATVLAYAGAQLGLQRIAEAILFPDPFASTDLSFIADRYKDAYTKPPLFDTSRPAFQWDGDRWYTNTLGHGLMGAELYFRARRCHFGAPASFAFVTAMSTTWEYVIEANGVRPSAWDLAYTPLSGLLFGEARYQGVRAVRGISSRPLRRVFEVVLDPMGEVGRAFGAPC